jgi:hypothetical protein
MPQNARFCALDALEPQPIGVAGDYDNDPARPAEPEPSRSMHYST